MFLVEVKNKYPNKKQVGTHLVMYMKHHVPFTIQMKSLQQQVSTEAVCTKKERFISLLYKMHNLLFV